MHLGGRSEASRDELLSLGDYFVRLGLGDTLDIDEALLGSVDDRLDRVVTGLLQLFDVGGADAVLLERRDGERPELILLILGGRLRSRLLAYDFCGLVLGLSFAPLRRR